MAIRSAPSPTVLLDRLEPLRNKGVDRFSLRIGAGIGVDAVDAVDGIDEIFKERGVWELGRFGLGLLQILL